jgi:hypothetical protein
MTGTRKLAGRSDKFGHKYLEIWNNYKHRMLTSPDYDEKKNKLAGRKESGARGWIDDTGRRKATDVFLEDLYLVWRASEGLPVWPAWYAKERGHYHGGKVCVNEPEIITVDEALELIGLKARSVATAAE